MQGHLYRYPHPLDASKFIYCGQGAKRDTDHRSGKSSFGRRFAKTFPSIALPQPIRETVEVVDQAHLNALETAWMVVYNTWHKHSTEAMNLLFCSTGYKRLIDFVSPETRRRNGLKVGRAAVESGQLMSMRSQLTKEQKQKASSAAARKCKERQIGIFALTKELQSEFGRRAGQKNVESGWAATLGKQNVESGQIAALGRTGVGGRTGNCFRWNIRRNKPCVCGRHKQEVAA